MTAWAKGGGLLLAGMALVPALVGCTSTDQQTTPSSVRPPDTSPSVTGSSPSAAPGNDGTTPATTLAVATIEPTPPPSTFRRVPAPTNQYDIAAPPEWVQLPTNQAALAELRSQHDHDGNAAFVRVIDALGSTLVVPGPIVGFSRPDGLAYVIATGTPYTTRDFAGTLQEALASRNLSAATVTTHQVTVNGAPATRVDIAAQQPTGTPEDTATQFWFDRGDGVIVLTFVGNDDAFDSVLGGFRLT